MELGVGADVVAKGMMATFCWEGGRGFSHTSVFPRHLSNVKGLK